MQLVGLVEVRLADGPRDALAAAAGSDRASGPAVPPSPGRGFGGCVDGGPIRGGGGADPSGTDAGGCGVA